MVAKENNQISDVMDEQINQLIERKVDIKDFNYHIN